MQSTFLQALPTLIILVICVSLIVLLVSRPQLIWKKKKGSNGYQTIDDRFNEERKEEQENIDQILEKIHKKGLHSLNKKEKELLTKHSEENG